MWKASITVTEASAISIMKNVSESDVAADAPAPECTIRDGLNVFNQELRLFHFHVNSAAQLPATMRYAAI